MILLLKIFFRVLGSVVEFAFLGACAMVVTCGGFSFIVGMVVALVGGLFSAISSPTGFGTPLSMGATAVLSYGLTFALTASLIAVIFSIPAFAIAALITSKRPHNEDLLGKIIAEATEGAKVSVVLGFILGAPSYTLILLIADSARGLSFSVDLQDFSRLAIFGALLGLGLGIFFGAIYGALGKSLPTHQILPMLRRWFKMSTHEK